MEGLNKSYSILETNDRKALVLLPVAILAGILMAIGVIGNAAVVLIIATRMPKKAINCLVLSLAFVDLCSCLICIPADIFELSFPVNFTSVALCKILRFTRSVATITSGFLLVAIATERYRLICKYTRSHFSRKQAMVIFGAVLTLSVCISWPALILFGSKTVNATTSLNGTECSIDDHFRWTTYPVVYYALLILLYFATFISLCVLYACVGFKIWKGRKLKPRRTPTISMYSDCAVRDATLNGQTENFLNTDTLKRAASTFGTMKRREYSRRRTTFIMVVMTSVFLVSCLPYVIISICRFVIKDMDRHLSESTELFFHFSLKSFILSTAVNPYIYGFCNERFKKELLNLAFLRRMPCLQEGGDNSDTTPSPQYSAANADESDVQKQSAAGKTKSLS